jgi:NitT/TauT family transport system substrate-binding protein
LKAAFDRAHHSPAKPPRQRRATEGENDMAAPTRSTRILALATGLVLAGFAAAVPAQAMETVRLGKAFGRDFYFAMAEVGQAAGIFAKHGVKLDIISFGGGAKLQQALASGSIDVGLSAGNDMVFALRGAPMKAVGAGYVGVSMVAAVGPHSKIRTVQDLKGARWGVPSPTSVAGFLPVALAKKEGWGPGGAKLVPGTPPPQAIALVKRGELDATPVDSTNAAEMAAKGEMRIAFDFNKAVSNYLMYAVYANNGFAAQHPAALKDFLAAWYDTIAYAQSHRAETVKTIAAAIHVPAEFVGKTYDTEVPALSATGRFPPAVIETMKNAFVTVGFVKAPPDLSTTYSEAFLPKK